MGSVTVRWPDVSWPAGDRSSVASAQAPGGVHSTLLWQDCSSGASLPTAASAGALNTDQRTHFPFSLPGHIFGFLAGKCLQGLFFLVFPYTWRRDEEMEEVAFMFSVRSSKSFCWSSPWWVAASIAGPQRTCGWTPPLGPEWPPKQTPGPGHSVTSRLP